MLSTADWRRTEEVIRAALKRGADPSEELDRLNMLATERRIKFIETAVLTRFAEQLDSWRPDEILRKISPGPWTPTETIMAIHQFLREYIDANKG